MKKNNKKLAPNGKQNKISLQIRRDIREGVYSPGEKLPSRIEIEQRYSSSPMTVQKAFDKLRADKYIYSEGPKGTFVSEKPPCFDNYAVVFPHHIDFSHAETDFYRILSELVSSDENKWNCSFTVYTGLNGHVDEPDYIRLFADIKAERIAGIIWATNPILVEDTPLFKDLLKRDYLPSVAFMSEKSRFGMPSIYEDNKKYKTAIFDFLEKKKVKKLAVVCWLEDVQDYSSPLSEFEKEVFAEAEKRGIDLPEHNLQVRHPALVSRTRGLVKLLLKRDEKDCPDALWITNDSLVESATQGIDDLGKSVAENLIVISHCNFPKKPKSKVDTYWYGLNVCRFIDMALEVLNKNKDGENTSLMTEIETEFCFD